MGGNLGTFKAVFLNHFFLSIPLNNLFRYFFPNCLSQANLIGLKTIYKCLCNTICILVIYTQNGNFTPETNFLPPAGNIIHPL